LIIIGKLLEENLPFGNNPGNGLGNEIISERVEEGRKE
jgi:hypothetical protein